LENVGAVLVGEPVVMAPSLRVVGGLNSRRLR
jgi:hypothetical protein